MFFDFGAGFLGRLFSAILEVIIYALVLIVVGMLLTAIGIALPAIVKTLVQLALLVYFLGRVFGFFGPR